MNDLTGQTINGYTLLELLGTGGQSAAYRASHDKYDEDVVVRGTLPEFADDAETVKRFQMEAVIFFRLKHPNIIPLLDYWRDNNGTWLVQQYMRGGSLRHKINAEADISLTLLASMLEDIAQALDFTHMQNIIHRDIKPDNILFDAQGTAYVHDFGVAKRLKSDAITRADVMIGSPAYFSPEQIQKLPVSPQTDIYILGIGLYEAITKTHPFMDVHTKMQLILKHLRTPLPPLSLHKPGVPESLDAVLKVATAKDPQDRYENVESFARAFRDALPLSDD